MRFRPLHGAIQSKIRSKLQEYQTPLSNGMNLDIKIVQCWSCQLYKHIILVKEAFELSS